MTTYLGPTLLWLLGVPCSLFPALYWLPACGARPLRALPMSFAWPFLCPTILNRCPPIISFPLSLKVLAPPCTLPMRPAPELPSKVMVSPTALCPDLSLWAPASLSPASQSLSAHSYCSAGAMCDQLSGSTHACMVCGDAGARRGMAWSGQKREEASRGSPGPLGIFQCPPSSHQEHSPTAVHGLWPLSRGS